MRFVVLNCASKRCHQRSFSSEFVEANAASQREETKYIERGKDIFGQTNGRPFCFFVVGDEQKFFLSENITTTSLTRSDTYSLKCSRLL